MYPRFLIVNMIITLRPRQNGCRFPDDIFKDIFLNENVLISIKISLKFVLNDPISNIPALVQIMAWRRPGDKSLSEPMMASLSRHICVTRPQWVICHNDSHKGQKLLFCQVFENTGCFKIIDATLTRFVTTISSHGFHSPWNLTHLMKSKFYVTNSLIPGKWFFTEYLQS